MPRRKCRFLGMRTYAGESELGAALRVQREYISPDAEQDPRHLDFNADDEDLSDCEDA